MYDEMIDFMERTAREAGALLRGRVYARHDVQYKGEINLVTEADHLSEELIVGRISERFPLHGVMAEESPEMKNDSGFRWIIDPLDGTTNYAHGYPVFAVSIALEVDGAIMLGAVYNPMSDDTGNSRRNRHLPETSSSWRWRTGPLQRSMSFPSKIISRASFHRK